VAPGRRERVSDFEALYDRAALLVELATAFLRGYFADGEWRTPSDLEDDVVGGVDVIKLTLGTSRFLETPFALALGRLIESGEIAMEEDEAGCWRYRKCDRVEVMVPR
jgi:hypothetical protein